MVIRANDATAQYRGIGVDYTSTPTKENPVWLAVVNYTQKDIDKSAIQDTYPSAKMNVHGGGLVGIYPVALLKYEFE